MFKKILLLIILITGLSCVLTAGTATAATSADETVPFEYNGQKLNVKISDLIITENGLELEDPSKYAGQIQVQQDGEDGEYYADDNYSEVNTYTGKPVNQGNAISERQYNEEQEARKWLNIVEDLNLRQIDEKALELVKEYSGAKSAVPPTLGQTGNVVFVYASYIPKIVCRPLYVTDIILEPGEMVNGVHPGDTTRWTFIPGEVGEGANRQISVLVKPLVADISTNLVITTTKRRYNINLMSSATEYMPSVSFTYPQQEIEKWDEFIKAKREERANTTTIETGYSITPEDIHLNYEIKGKDTIKWKPVAVYDDGVKTYIKFREKSTIKSVEAPVFVVFEKKKEIIVNYRFAANDMMIVDKVFDVGALIVGNGATQDRVTIKRLKTKQ